MQNLHRQAIDLLNRVRGYADSPRVKSLEQEIQRLIDEFEMQKNARSLENRVNQVERQLGSLGEADMDHRHQDDVRDRLQDLRMGLRKFQ